MCPLPTAQSVENDMWLMSGHFHNYEFFIKLCVSLFVLNVTLFPPFWTLDWYSVQVHCPLSSQLEPGKSSVMNVTFGLFILILVEKIQFAFEYGEPRRARSNIIHAT